MAVTIAGVEPRPPGPGQRCGGETLSAAPSRRDRIAAVGARGVGASTQRVEAVLSDDVQELQCCAGRLALAAFPLAHGVDRHIHKSGENRLTDARPFAQRGDFSRGHRLDLRQRVPAEHPQRRLGQLVAAHRADFVQAAHGVHDLAPHPRLGAGLGLSFIRHHSLR